MTNVFHSFHICLYVYYKPITLLMKIFSARQRDIKMFLRRESNLGELDFQGAQDEIAQKEFKRKTSYQKYSAEDRFKIGTSYHINYLLAFFKFNLADLIYVKKLT